MYWGQTHPEINFPEVCAERRGRTSESIFQTNANGTGLPTSSTNEGTVTVSTLRRRQKQPGLLRAIALSPFAHSERGTGLPRR